MRSLVNQFKPLILILFILVFFVPSKAQNGSKFSDEYLPIWERAKDYSLVMVRAMPDTLLDYRPVAEVRSFREQVGHMMDNMSFLQYYLTGERDSPVRGISKDLDQMTKEELNRNLETCFDYIAYLLKNTPEEELDDTVSFFVSDVTMTRKGIFYLLRNHVTHHRAQLIMYLRLNGIEPPRYVGW